MADSTQENQFVVGRSDVSMTVHRLISVTSTHPAVISWSDWICETSEVIVWVCSCGSHKDSVSSSTPQPFQKKHSPTHHPDHHPIFISFFHLPRSIASSLFKLRAWQSFHVLFGLPLGLEPSTSYSIHFFTQSVSSFRSTCPYHCNLFCCSINITSSICSLSLNFLLGTLSFTLTLHIHLTILISVCITLLVIVLYVSLYRRLCSTHGGVLFRRCTFTSLMAEDRA